MAPCFFLAIIMRAIFPPMILYRTVQSSSVSRSIAKVGSRSGRRLESLLAPFGARTCRLSAPWCCRAAGGDAFDLRLLYEKSWHFYSAYCQEACPSYSFFTNFCKDRSALECCPSPFVGLHFWDSLNLLLGDELLQVTVSDITRRISNSVTGFRQKS